ncbi:MAG: hypothetical protein MJ252_18880 [archaeon]|nr:hypothetical protein [archaeon]
MYCINIGFLFFMFYSLWNFTNGIILFFGLILSFAQLSSYALTATINPGIPKKSYEQIANSSNNNGNYKRCTECGLWRKVGENTYHCSECVNNKFI